MESYDSDWLATREPPRPHMAAAAGEPSLKDQPRQALDVVTVFTGSGVIQRTAEDRDREKQARLSTLREKYGYSSKWRRSKRTPSRSTEARRAERKRAKDRHAAALGAEVTDKPRRRYS